MINDSEIKKKCQKLKTKLKKKSLESDYEECLQLATKIYALERVIVEIYEGD